MVEGALDANNSGINSDQSGLEGDEKSRSGPIVDIDELAAELSKVFSVVVEYYPEGVPFLMLYDMNMV